MDWNSSHETGEIVQALVSDVTIPKMVTVARRFPRPALVSIRDSLEQAMLSAEVVSRIPKNGKVAVAVGSRGITNQIEVLRRLVEMIRTGGGLPFIVPSMGSHGGATADGQVKILADLGISEETVGAAIHSSMETVVLGKTASGLPVYCDTFAAGADGVIPVNRIKPHVAFRGRFESGLMKMLAIGLGKQKGAESCHALGFGEMARHIPEAGKLILNRVPVLFGVGLLENAYHETAEIVVVPAERIEAEEPALLERAWELSPSIGIERFDVLVIDQIGKDISGTGFDTNVVGRYHTPYASGGPEIKRVVVLEITPASRGNGNGLGMADFTTRKAFETFRFDQTYPNALTSTVPLSVKIPMVLGSGREAVQAAIRTANLLDPADARVVRIKNTIEMETIEVSRNIAKEIDGRDGFTIISEPHEMLLPV